MEIMIVARKGERVGARRRGGINKKIPCGVGGGVSPIGVIFYVGSLFSPRGAIFSVGGGGLFFCMWRGGGYWLLPPQ